MALTQAGHGWDVKSVDWHPTKSLLVSGMLFNNLFFLPCFPQHVQFLKTVYVFLCDINNVYCIFIGGKDNLVKLWDAKSGKELSSLLVQMLF